MEYSKTNGYTHVVKVAQNELKRANTKTFEYCSGTSSSIKELGRFSTVGRAILPRDMFLMASKTACKIFILRNEKFHSNKWGGFDSDSPKLASESRIVEYMVVKSNTARSGSNQ